MTNNFSPNFDRGDSADFGSSRFETLANLRADRWALMGLSRPGTDNSKKESAEFKQAVALNEIQEIIESGRECFLTIAPDQSLRVVPGLEQETLNWAQRISGVGSEAIEVSAIQPSGYSNGQASREQASLFAGALVSCLPAYRDLTATGFERYVCVFGGQEPFRAFHTLPVEMFFRHLPLGINTKTLERLVFPLLSDRYSLAINGVAADYLNRMKMVPSNILSADSAETSETKKAAIKFAMTVGRGPDSIGSLQELNLVIKQSGVQPELVLCLEYLRGLLPQRDLDNTSQIVFGLANHIDSRVRQEARQTARRLGLRQAA